MCTKTQQLHLYAYAHTRNAYPLFAIAHPADRKYYPIMWPSKTKTISMPPCGPINGRFISLPAGCWFYLLKKVWPPECCTVVIQFDWSTSRSIGVIAVNHGSGLLRAGCVCVFGCTRWELGGRYSRFGWWKWRNEMGLGC